jgi:hypothetical protein
MFQRPPALAAARPLWAPVAQSHGGRRHERDAKKAPILAARLQVASTRERQLPPAFRSPKVPVDEPRCLALRMLPVECDAAEPTRWNKLPVVSALASIAPGDQEKKIVFVDSAFEGCAFDEWVVGHRSPSDDLTRLVRLLPTRKCLLRVKLDINPLL